MYSPRQGGRILPGTRNRQAEADEGGRAVQAGHDGVCAGDRAQTQAHVMVGNFVPVPGKQVGHQVQEQVPCCR